MGRWWTGYTSIAGDRACIFHSHGVLWRFASPCCRQSSHGYGLFEATIPSEKMRWIHSLRGAECEFKDHTELCIALINDAIARGIPGDFTFDSYFTSAKVLNHIES